MKPLVVIPARGGSKGVPGKNIKPLGGKPLIHYTIEAALAVFPPEIICVSTDFEEIKACAEQAGLRVPFLRPSELATDTAGTREVLLHAVDFYEAQGYFPDVVILLQPTSPFRTAQHIKEALGLFTADLDMVVSVKETKSNPYYVLFEEDENGYLQSPKKGEFTRRQDCTKVWEYNGAVYIINVQSLKSSSLQQFKNIRKFVMSEEVSLDIDSEMDWKVAEVMLGNRES